MRLAWGSLEQGRGRIPASDSPPLGLRAGWLLVQLSNPMTQEGLKVLYKVNNSNPGTRKALQNRPKEVSSRPATQTSTTVPGVSVAGLSTCRKVLQQQDSAPLRGLGASPQAEALFLGNKQVKGSGSHSNPSRCRRDPRTHLTKANVPQTQIPWGFL